MGRATLLKEEMGRRWDAGRTREHASIASSLDVLQVLMSSLRSLGCPMYMARPRRGLPCRRSTSPPPRPPSRSIPPLPSSSPPLPRGPSHRTSVRPQQGSEGDTRATGRTGATSANARLTTRGYSVLARVREGGGPVGASRWRRGEGWHSGA
jgi:hypothetical protein